MTVKFSLFLILGLLPNLLIFGQAGFYLNGSTNKKALRDATTGKYYTTDVYDDMEWCGDPQYIKVRQGKHYGVINVNGSIILPALFDSVSKYPNNNLYFTVKLNGKLGLSGKGGKGLPCEFEYVQSILPNLLVGEKLKGSGQFDFFDQNGNYLFSKSGNEIRQGFNPSTFLLVTDFWKHQFFDAKGNPAFPEHIKNGIWTDGKTVIVAGYGDQYNSIHVDYGMVTIEGKEIAPRKYKEIKPITVNRFIFKTFDQKSGIFNETGQVISPLVKGQLAHVNPFSSSIFSFNTKNSWSSMLNKDGILISEECQLANAFLKESMFWFWHPMDSIAMAYTRIVTKNMKYGLFDSDGAQILPIEFDSIRYWHSKSAILGYRADKVFIYNFSGKLVFPFPFASVEFTRHPAILFAKQEDSDKWAILNLTQRKPKHKFVYSDIKPMDYGFHAVQTNLGFKICDPYGKIEKGELFSILRKPTVEEDIQFSKYDQGKLAAVGILKKGQSEKLVTAIAASGKRIVIKKEGTDTPMFILK